MAVALAVEVSAAASEEAALAAEASAVWAVVPAMAAAVAAAADLRSKRQKKALALHRAPGPLACRKSDTL